MSIEESRNTGLGQDNTIIAFRLADWQLDVLNKAVGTREINGRKLNIYHTDILTDLFAIPYFVAFINFETVGDADRETFREFWRECREPLSEEILHEFSPDSINPKKKIVKMPLTFVFNYNESDMEEGDYLFINRDIFSDRERLRLMIMQEISNLEGNGRKANIKASDKLIRVMHIYHDLVYNRWTSKEKVGKWLARERENQISDRTFLRYMEIIKEIDKNVKYNPESKRYELNKDV